MGEDTDGDGGNAETGDVGGRGETSGAKDGGGDAGGTEDGKGDAGEGEGSTEGSTGVGVTASGADSREGVSDIEY